MKRGPRRGGAEGRGGDEQTPRHGYVILHPVLKIVKAKAHAYKGGGA